MGYHSMNQAKLERRYEPDRKLIASVYDDETQQWYTEEFEWDQINEALARIAKSMISLST
jgi:hypothetical protein